MNRIRAARSLVLGCALALGIGSVGHAQRTEVDTLVRGENVRLWAEPAPDTDLVAILQRGDEILITGDAELPDGSTMPVTAQTLGIAYDVFVPVELVETGETGWISEIFVDPRSFVPISSAGADVSTNIPRGTASVDNANTAAEDSGNAQQANRKNRRQNEKAAASDESAASATDVATTEADASQTKQQKRNKKNAHRAIGMIKPPTTPVRSGARTTWRPARSTTLPTSERRSVAMGSRLPWAAPNS